MTKQFIFKPLAAALLASVAIAAPVVPVQAQSAGSDALTLSAGRGQLVRLPRPMSDLFVANDQIADVQVRSPTMLYVFGKSSGETTVSATARDGSVVYAATVRVGQNISNVGQMLKVAMPESTIEATVMNGIVLLSGTAAQPEDVGEAEKLALAFVGDKYTVVNRIRAASPQQVNLQVRIVEVNRALAKEIGLNLISGDPSSKFGFLIGQGRNFGNVGGYVDPTGNPITPSTPVGQRIPNWQFGGLGQGAGRTNIAAFGRLFGLDIGAALDLAENDGLLTTLANPNLTAISGEKASFLAGGEIPIPLAQEQGQVTVEYKQYGVSLSFIPTVLGDGRIFMRVRPEVSELSAAGGVTLNGFSIPGIVTRRAETTVELGSGQSFMIAGLLSNTVRNQIDKAPFLGDVPILGNLFKSQSYRRSETELMIVVTPYLVKPVSANQLKFPTDGYKAPTDAQRYLGGQSFVGTSGSSRPMPSQAPATNIAPMLAPPTAQAALDPQPKKSRRGDKKRKNAAADPGFSF
jgi:pilus assembly protein CpaC